MYGIILYTHIAICSSKLSSIKKLGALCPILVVEEDDRVRESDLSKGEYQKNFGTLHFCLDI